MIVMVRGGGDGSNDGDNGSHENDDRHGGGDDGSNDGDNGNQW